MEYTPPPQRPDAHTRVNPWTSGLCPSGPIPDWYTFVAEARTQRSVKTLSLGSAARRDTVRLIDTTRYTLTTISTPTRPPAHTLSRGRVTGIRLVAECVCVEYSVYVAALAERQRVGPKGEHKGIIVDGKAHEAWVSATRGSGSHAGVAPEWTMTFFSTGMLTSDPVQGVLTTVSGYGLAAPVTAWSTAPIMELMDHRGEVL